MRPVPQRALDELERSEGKHDGDKSTPNVWEPQADPVGIYTVGFGYALFENGEPVRDRATAMRIWRERWPDGFGYPEAKALLVAVAQDVSDRVLRLLPGVDINDNELSALVCLSYNIGVGEEGGKPDFADSTVRRRLLRGDRVGAAEAMLMWVKGGGKVIHGLELRRERERRMFLEPVAGAATAPVIVPATAPAPVPAAPPTVTPAHKSTTVRGAGLTAAIPLVMAAGSFVLQRCFGMDEATADQTRDAIIVLLSSIGGGMVLVGRADANIKPLGKP